MADIMSLLQAYIDPASTHQILSNLNSAIDEVKLKATLNGMSNRIQQIEKASGPSKRSLQLRREITILEVQINYIKDQATII